MPEVAAVAILVSVAVLAAGGCVAGIARFVTTTGAAGPGADTQLTWNAVTFGAQWASPVVAVLLLAVIGLCWWQLQAWTELIESPDPDDDLADAIRHIRRARLIARWALVGVAGTAVGAIALFAAQVATSTGLPDGDWTVEIAAAAGFLAVVALLAATLWAGRRLGRLSGPAGAAVDAP
jgi:hypothetical protein